VVKGHKSLTSISANSMPSKSDDLRDAIHWFIDNVGLYHSSVRGLFVTDFSEEQEAVLEAANINLKSRNVTPLIITGEAIYKQADYLWRTAVSNATFGRPVASKLELDLAGNEVVFVKDLEAPESAHHLWYLFHHIFYPRALFNKPLLVTSPLSYEEFITYGAGCDDLEFAGRKITWEKLLWSMDATMIDLQHYQMLRDESLPPMLKPEYYLYRAMKERGLEVIPQHVLGDYQLDFALFDRERKLDIEVDVFASLDLNKPSSADVRRNLQLLSDGWKIVRFTTAEILSNLTACVDAVEEVWAQGRKKSSSGRLLSGTQPTSVPELPVDDDTQRLAITHGAGPAALDGSAGTGKSSCIAHRVAYLLAQGVNPERILVITYSPEGVRHLKGLMETNADRQAAQKVQLFCWHDLGFKILKENLGAIKRKPPLKLENNPQKVLGRQIAKFKKDMDPTMLELSEELDEFTLSTLVSLYKANLVTPKHLKEMAKTNVDELVSKVFQAYEEQLQKANRIDRDDMICLVAQILLDQPDVRIRYQYQYDFVLVDEYQDATASCDLIARLLAFPQDNVFLVGDEDESIFESKGSLPRLMSEVSIRLPNARCYVLEKNWRSHPVIVDHARQFRSHLTKRRIQKDMTSGWGAAPTTAIIGPQTADSEETECEWIADEVSILIDSGRAPHEIAVLLRDDKYTMFLEESLSRRSIRCLTTNPQSALVPDECGDVMAFLNLVMDPDGPKARESFERICQLRVKEVDPKLSATIASFAESNNLSYLKGIEIYWQAVQDPSCRELEQLVRIIRTMHQEKLPPAETISLLKRTQRLSEYYRQIKVAPGVNYEPMRKLAVLEEEARKFQSVSEFVKSYNANQQTLLGADSEQAVQVLNVHEVKGREFPIVFLAGLAEGIFPSVDETDVEEEKRLFYVAMTRAKELLYLSFPATFGKLACQPSSFLVDARLMLPATRTAQTAAANQQVAAQQAAAQQAAAQQAAAQQAAAQQAAAETAQQLATQQAAAEEAARQLAWQQQMLQEAAEREQIEKEQKLQLEAAQQQALQEQNARELEEQEEYRRREHAEQEALRVQALHRQQSQLQTLQQQQQYMQEQAIREQELLQQRELQEAAALPLPSAPAQAPAPVPVAEPMTRARQLTSDDLPDDPPLASAPAASVENELIESGYLAGPKPKGKAGRPRKQKGGDVDETIMEQALGLPDKTQTQPAAQNSTSDSELSGSHRKVPSEPPPYFAPVPETLKDVLALDETFHSIPANLPAPAAPPSRSRQDQTTASNSASDIDDLLELADQAPRHAAPTHQVPASFSSSSIDDLTDRGSLEFNELKPANQSTNVPAETPAVHFGKCRDCGAALEIGSRFCGECGGAQPVEVAAEPVVILPPVVTKCPACGVYLEKSAKFCGECGNPRPFDVAALGISAEQLAAVPQEALSDGDAFKKWMAATNPQKRQSWMVQVLKFLEG
jgi:DNA helicase-2/ATP-dependent DNA helicase PcrA